MGIKGSKSTRPTTPPARRPSGATPSGVTGGPSKPPPPPTVSRPPVSRPTAGSDDAAQKSGKMQFKGVVSFRDGPAAAKLEKMGRGTSLQFYSDNEVRNNYSELQSLRGNVRVRGGRWYFETVIQTTSNIYIGWCTKEFKGEADDLKHAGCDKASWAWDGSRPDGCVAIHEGKEVPYGKKWGGGSVIGCALDCGKREIEYFLNGTSLGIAFGGVEIPEKGLYPVISLSSGQRVKVNFGATDYQYPRPGYFSLHSHIGPEGLAKLEQVYKTYFERGVAAGDKADMDALQPQGVTLLMQDMGLDPDGLDMLILEWKVGVRTPYEFPRIDFLAGFDQLRCADLSAMKALVQSTKRAFEKDADQFRTFYMWAFDFMKEKPTAKAMGPDAALLTWQVVLDGRWPLLNDFATFFEEHKTPVNKDLWRMVLNFSIKIGGDLKNYSDKDAWSTILDEFVEYMKTKGGQ